MSSFKNSEQCWNELIKKLEQLMGFNDDFFTIKHLVQDIEKYAYSEGERMTKRKMQKKVKI